MSVEIKGNGAKWLQRSLLPAGLLVAAIILFPFNSFCQEEKKLVPDGTTGLVLEVGPDDYLKKKKTAE